MGGAICHGFNDCFAWEAQGLYELLRESNLPRIPEEFCVAVRVELHQLPIGAICHGFKDCFAWEAQGLYKLLRESNLPRIPEEFCAGV